eukprot:CAMPEP_0173434920 /NCGR_PEP_ID=MMETSP1357-20121228/13792_1 /TAXON_ID=77926 /ORGANISM="Hemiselmis rufescens, Strain PCC563" /LENGTH=48 /DNA_ID= /DNA_START= /DNA_END= /DNA_ORIENTATION=
MFTLLHLGDHSAADAFNLDPFEARTKAVLTHAANKVLDCQAKERACFD